MNIFRIQLVLILLLSPLSLLAEMPVSIEVIKDASRAWGFVSGQKYSLNQVQKKYPDLKQNSVNAEKEFLAIFGDSLEEIERYMTQHLKQNWTVVKSEIKDNIDLSFQNQQYSRKDAAAFLKQVKDRAKGIGIETPSYETLLMFKPAYQKNPHEEFLHGFKYRYKSDGSGKAKGVRFHIDIPATWKAAEGDRPNIVQKFRNKNGHGMAHIMFMVRKISDNENDPEINVEIQSLLLDGNISEFVPDGYKLVSGGKLMLEGQPGYWLKLKASEKRLRYTIDMEMLTYSIFFKNFNIQIHGQIATSLNGEAVNDGDIKKYESLFDQVANSLVLQDVYSSR